MLAVFDLDKIDKRLRLNRMTSSLDMDKSNSFIIEKEEDDDRLVVSEE
jgi:hypothetical protein